MASLIALIFSIVLLIIILVLAKQSKEENQYEFSTGAGKFVNVFKIVFYSIGILFLLISFIVSFDKTEDNVIAQWVLFGFGLFCTIFGLIFFYVTSFEREHIKGDEVIIRRFFRKIHIKITDIKLINKLPQGFIFFGENNKKLFTVDIYTKGISEFIHLLVEKSKELNCSFILEVDGVATTSNVTLDPTNEEHREEIDKYIKIGEAYKSEYLNRLADAKLTLIFDIALLVLYIFALIVGQGTSIFYFILGGIFIGISVSQYKKLVKNYAIEMNRSEFETGQSYAHKCDIVVGNSKKKYNRQYYTAGVAVALAAISLIGFISSINPPLPDYEKLIAHSGTLEYVYEYFDDEDYIGFGFVQNKFSATDLYEKSEFRLPEFCMTTFDDSIFDLPMVDENGNDIDYKMVLYVDKSAVYDDISAQDEDKVQYFNIYYVRINDVEYFNEDMMNDAYRIYNNKMILGSVLCGAVILGSIAMVVLFAKKTHDAKKKEYIVL